MALGASKDPYCARGIEVILGVRLLRKKESMHEFVIVKIKRTIRAQTPVSFIKLQSNLQISGIASGLLVEYICIYINIFDIILSSLRCSTLHTFVFEANSHS